MIFLTFPVVCNYEMVQARDRSGFLLAGRAILAFEMLLVPFCFFLDLELKDEDEQRVVKMETNNHLGLAMFGAETRMFTTL